jgi:hypothetical protein
VNKLFIKPIAVLSGCFTFLERTAIHIIVDRRFKEDFMKSLRSVISLLTVVSLVTGAATLTAQEPAASSLPLFLLRAADQTDLYICVTGTSPYNRATFHLFVGPSKQMKEIMIEHSLQSEYNGSRYLETSSTTLSLPWHDREKIEQIPRFDPYWPIQTRSEDPKWGEKPFVFLDPAEFVIAKNGATMTISRKEDPK